MKGNEISANKLSGNAEHWISQLVQVLTIKEYGAGTIKSYGNEMVLLFKYYQHKDVELITQQDIEQYLMYIKSVHKVGRAKCRSVAQACSFFFQKVMKINYIVPSNLYPKKQFLLPNIMSEDEVKQLFKAPLTLKEYCVIGLMYGCGMRISEVCNLRLRDIESHAQRIKIYQGKGSKDRYTLLPHILLEHLRAYYIAEGRPKEYLFTSTQTNRAYCVRSMQVVVNGAMAKAGYGGCGFTAHTMRHSFATHLLNSGVNIHVIKTLLGHAKLETTMVYLHLQKHTQMGIVSPLDQLKSLPNGDRKDQGDAGAQ
jgi:site-specific recombinase XerD